GELASRPRAIKRARPYNLRPPRGPRGGGAHEPTGIEPLPEGSVVHNLTYADTEVAYERMIGDTPQREAAIWEHFESGERIVVQGREDTTEMADDVEPEFGSQNYGGRKHFHTVDPVTNLTPEEALYPSAGPDSDMERVRGDARRA